MKHIFSISLVLLILASFLTWATKPEQQTAKPVLYWVTDNNPVRQGQVDAFHVWLKENAPEEDQFILRVDPANNSNQKVIIQCVSGVGGDIMDTATDSGSMQYFRQMGIIQDITDLAKEHNFGVDKTYGSVAAALQVDGRQYMFPCNIYTNMYWANLGTFKELGVRVPSKNWSFAEFEKLGKDFRAAAIKEHGEKKGRRYFMVNRIECLTVMRNWGIDAMNETLSGSALMTTTRDGKNYEKAMRQIHTWTKDNLLPSATDLSNIATESAHGGAGTQMFRNGNYGMYLSGRWALCQFRLYPEFKDFAVDILPPPQDGFNNTSSGSRAAVMYAGYSDRRKRLAAYFFQFLASDAYNQTIVDSADAIPPSPSYAQTDAYKTPVDFPNEHGVHEAYSNALRDIGVLITHSPFVETNIIKRQTTGAEAAVMAEPSLREADEAAALAHERIEERIQLNIKENPSLRPAYEKACADQKEIDALKAAGKKIPRALITNRYYLKYYASKGLLE
ncbi:MAG: carbohydrate ABC transporter substrate-binding protein [Planctomycetes bacterium]|nr:carbohydrate ABC transporter substrate-binding protein [Planctomycetota bacterium]